MKHCALAVTIILLGGCVSSGSPTTQTDPPAPREGRGVEYPKEVPLGGLMHIEGWGCKGYKEASIALEPPRADLSDPRSYWPDRIRLIDWIGGRADVSPDKDGQFSVDFYIRPDGAEGRYRVTGFCVGDDTLAAYYDGELLRTNYSSNNVSGGVRLSF